jgi:GNAT superfamily N-acetyltransferase
MSSGTGIEAGAAETSEFAPMETLTITPGRPEDVPAILDLIKGLAEYERMAADVVATETSLQTWLFGPRPVAETVLARRDGLAIGFALFFHNFSTFLGRPGLYLEDLYVVPGWRGRGVGRRLLAHVARLAVQRGCGRMEWSVLEWNEAAISFYQRAGARVLEDWRICRLTGDALHRLAAKDA